MLYHQTELDKRLGCSWHVVVGEEFGFDVTYEVRDVDIMKILRLRFGMKGSIQLIWENH